MLCTQATPPIKMEGRWQNEMPVTFEWVPGKYFILRTGEESKEFIGVMRQILMMRPVVHLSGCRQDACYRVAHRRRRSALEGNSG